MNQVNSDFQPLFNYNDVVTYFPALILVIVAIALISNKDKVLNAVKNFKTFLF